MSDQTQLVSSQTFMEDYLQGRVLAEDIDDYIDEWHEGDGSVELHSYLGMTWDEYSKWLDHDEVALAWIAAARKENRSANDILYDIENMPLAARSDNPDKSQAIKLWMSQQGIDPDNE